MLALAACEHLPTPERSALDGTPPPAPAATSPFVGRRTTSGSIAVANLESQIDGIERIGRGRALTVAERLDAIELRLVRGQVLGRISDYEAAVAAVDGLVREAPLDSRFWILQARVVSTLHRFSDAHAALTRAEELGLPTSVTDGVRAGLLLATGRIDEALVLRARAAALRPDIQTLGDEAVVRAARGELDQAERLFEAAVASYRDVSPFPVAWIEFQRGLMWMREDEMPRAREWLAAAHQRLPQHAQAQGHLAEVEAAFGNVDRAVELLRPLAESSEDPDYAAQLARILGEAGRADEAKPWRARAAARYDELMATHPRAYADHAAEFWLAAGADPGRALGYAEDNLALRPTVRAWELVFRAAQAKGDAERACAAATGARKAGYLYGSARTAIDELSSCQEGQA